MKQHYLFKFIGLVSILIVMSDMPVAAAVTPDPGILNDLRSVFNQSFKVTGYPYQDEIETAANRYGLPVPFVLAVARGESFFDPNAKSATGAIGIMQVMPKTSSEYGVAEKELFDPKKNIDVGVHYLSDLHQKLKDPYLTLAAYYCGCGGVDKNRFTIRQDCDEYVRYIHTHLKSIISMAEGKIPTHKGRLEKFEIARFDNYLDAQDFVMIISKKLSHLQFDLFRTQIKLPDHYRFQYQIIASHGKETSKTDICRQIQAATGFKFCK